MRALMTGLFAGLLLLSGCGGADGGSGSSKGAAPSAEASPKPVRYDVATLGAALPKDINGKKPVEECRDLTAWCQGSGSGIGLVSASGKSMTGPRVWLWVEANHDENKWAGYVKGCPQGAFEKKVKDVGSGYTPGEKGTSRRTAISQGTWKGFLCHQDLVYVMRDSEEVPMKLDTAYLTNGFHLVHTNGRSPKEAEQLATDYIAELERLAKTRS